MEMIRLGIQPYKWLKNNEGSRNPGYGVNFIKHRTVLNVQIWSKYCKLINLGKPENVLLTASEMGENH